MGSHFANDIYIYILICENDVNIFVLCLIYVFFKLQAMSNPQNILKVFFVAVLQVYLLCTVMMSLMLDQRTKTCRWHAERRFVYTVMSLTCWCRFASQTRTKSQL